MYEILNIVKINTTRKNNSYDSSSYLVKNCQKKKMLNLPV